MGLQWIQQLIVVNMETGVLTIPPPILTRCFAQLGDGMVACHEALLISTTPFPFPYAQVCDLLLVLHWLAVPVVMAPWGKHPGLVAVLTFIQVLILWSLKFIAVELENPF